MRNARSCWAALLNCRSLRPAEPWFDCESQERSLILMPDKISVLLVDDHALVRRGFRRILEDEPDMTVAGEAGDGLSAIRLAHELRPKVIVMDCAMPGMKRVGSHAADSWKAAAGFGAHAQHASGGDSGAAGARGRSARLLF